MNKQKFNYVRSVESVNNNKIKNDLTRSTRGELTNKTTSKVSTYNKYMPKKGGVPTDTNRTGTQYQSDFDNKIFSTANNYQEYQEKQKAVQKTKKPSTLSTGISNTPGLTISSRNQQVTAKVPAKNNKNTASGTDLMKMENKHLEEEEGSEEEEESPEPEKSSATLPEKAAPSKAGGDKTNGKAITSSKNVSVKGQSNLSSTMGTSRASFSKNNALSKIMSPYKPNSKESGNVRSKSKDGKTGPRGASKSADKATSKRVDVDVEEYEYEADPDYGSNKNSGAGGQGTKVAGKGVKPSNPVSINVYSMNGIMKVPEPKKSTNLGSKKA